MRPRVAGMVWLPKADISPELLEHFRVNLTFVPRVVGNYGNKDVDPNPVKCYVDTPTEFGVPRAYWFSHAKKDYDYIWDVSSGSPIELASSLTHVNRYAEQQDIINVFAKRFEGSEVFSDRPGAQIGDYLGGILEAQTGAGKTDTALGLANRLGRTTVVLTHKKFLMRQWAARIHKWMPDAKVGIVQESKCEFEGCDFVIAMMESLALDDGTRYPQALYDAFGFLIADEVHRVGARTWSPLPPKFTAAYRLGLSATPRRKDDADVVFWWHIGRVVYQAQTQMPVPHVRMKLLPKPFDPPHVLTLPGKNDATVITLLAKMSGRNHKIVEEIVKALKAPSGRKIMVLSERLEHLRTLESQLRAMVDRDPAFEHEEVTTSFYVGEWFTGESVPALKPGQWPMTDGGRQKAIDVIYRSVSRRKGYSGNIHVDEITVGGQPLVDDKGKPIERKVHVVQIPSSDMLNLFGDSCFFSDVAPYPVTIENLTDEELYGMASYYRIKQKAQEKMKPRTEAELHEAERARVLFATFQMCGEGVDLPAVDTEVLASPVSDVEQAVGRERRFCDPEPEKCAHFCPWRAGVCQGKPHPIVSDIVDLGYPLASKRERYREAFYQRIGCKIARGRA